MFDPKHFDRRKFATLGAALLASLMPANRVTIKKLQKGNENVKFYQQVDFASSVSTQCESQPPRKPASINCGSQIPSLPERPACRPSCR
jgi:hypothetical protein